MSDTSSITKPGDSPYASAPETKPNSRQIFDLPVPKKRTVSKPITSPTGSTSETSDADNAETGKAVVQTVVDANKDPATASPFGGTIDAIESESGKQEGKRAGKVIDETIDRLAETEVVEVKEGEKKKIITADGEKVKVKLQEGQDSKVVETKNGETILVVSEDLSEAEVVHEVVEFIIHEIEYELFYQGFDVIGKFRDVFKRDIFRHFHAEAFSTAIQYAKFLYQSLAL